MAGLKFSQKEQLG